MVVQGDSRCVVAHARQAAVESRGRDGVDLSGGGGGGDKDGRGFLSAWGPWEGSKTTLGEGCFVYSSSLNHPVSGCCLCVRLSLIIILCGVMAAGCGYRPDRSDWLWLIWSSPHAGGWQIMTEPSRGRKKGPDPTSHARTPRCSCGLTPAGRMGSYCTVPTWNARTSRTARPPGCWDISRYLGQVAAD